MHLSLNCNTDESGVSMILSVVIGHDKHRNPITDTFFGSVNFFLKLIERLKKLPAGNPMNDSIRVDVELSKGGLVHFGSTRLYVGSGGSSDEEIVGINMTLCEFMAIPEEDLGKLITIHAVSEYKKRMPLVEQAPLIPD